MEDERAFAQSALAGDRLALQTLDAALDALALDDESRQLLHARLIFQRKLAGFTGRTPFRQWLKAVAARVEIDRRRERREAPLEVLVLDHLLPAEAPARKAKLLAVLAGLLSALPERERLFVQHHFVDGLTLTAIGRLHEVAASTVMRTLERCLAGLSRALSLELNALSRTREAGLVSPCSGSSC